jgi:pyruvate dehydrogenase E1 component alpha subunit
VPLTTSSADALSAGQMALIRAFELRAAEMYTRAKIGGYCHLNLGEEATVVGLMAALRPEDYLFTTYREHGYALARGAGPGDGRVVRPD